MFEVLFKKMEEKIAGFRFAAVVGDDGMEVEMYMKSELPHEILSAEMNGIVRTINRMQDELNLGKLSEMVIRAEEQNVILFSLQEGLFILVVTEASEATGRTRYLIQAIAHEFMSILS